MSHDSVSRRIAADRGVAGFFALIAALPAFAACVGLIYVGYRVLTDAHDQDMRGASGVIWIAGIGVFALLLFVVSRWTYDSVHAAMTPQRVQAMWLRRFQTEKGAAFRPSRVIDRLSRHGVSALTLQDRDVQLSFEQRRNRLAPIFWLLFIPIAAATAYLMWNGWQTASHDIINRPLPNDLRAGIGQIIGSFIALIAIAALLLVGFFAALLATIVAVMLIAALAGPIGRVFAGKRDDYAHLPRLLARIREGKRPKGAQVLRISDAHWQEAVTSSLGAADVAIIDLSNVSENVAWEIGEAAKACSASGLVFIAREGTALPDAARAALRAALGREPTGTIYYPERAEGGARFSRALRERIYDAVDLRRAVQS
jgi:hypothetical protein